MKGVRIIHRVSITKDELRKKKCDKRTSCPTTGNVKRAGYCWNVILRSISGNRFYVFIPDGPSRAHENGQRPSLRRKLEFNGAAVGILMNFSNVSRAEFRFHRSEHDWRQLIRIVSVNNSARNSICRFSITSALPRCRRNRFDVR